MDTALKKDRYECMTLVWSETASREAGTEYIVPDAMPDIGEIVGAEGILTIRGKETSPGAVQVSTSSFISVVYVPEGETGLRCLELAIPSELKLDAPGVDSECVAVIRTRIRAVDARALNSRKISVRAELETEVSCYRRDTLELTSGLSSPVSIHVLGKTETAMLIRDVREKTFVVTDVYSFPEGMTGTGKIISRRVEPALDEVKYIDGKAVFHGVIRTEALFSLPDSDTVCVGRYQTEFSQIMEIGGMNEDMTADISLFLTGAYYDLAEYGGDDGKLQAEIHLAAQCVCRQRQEFRYIADLYSNCLELIPETETFTLVANARPVSVRQTVAGRAETMTEEGEIIRVSAAVRGVAREDDAVKTTVNVNLLCRDGSGMFFSARARLNAEFTLPDISPGAALCGIRVTVLDAYCHAPADDVHVTLRMDALVLEERALTCVSEIREGEGPDEGKKLPSCVLVRVPEGTDMWKLARQYHSTTEAIASVNDDRNSGLLLIPRTR